MYDFCQFRLVGFFGFFAFGFCFCLVWFLGSMLQLLCKTKTTLCMSSIFKLQHYISGIDRIGIVILFWPPQSPPPFFCSNLSLHTCKCTTRPNIKNIFLSGIFFGHAFKWLSGAFRSPCCQITTHYSGSKQGYINLIHHQNLFLFLC